jgi:hypothetical protein
MTPLLYNYHDAIIKSIEILETKFILKIDLYPIFYPLKPAIELKFNVVNHLNDCIKWKNLLLENFDDGDNYLGARLNDIKISEDVKNNEKKICIIDCNGMHKLKLKFKATIIKEIIKN